MSWTLPLPLLLYAGVVAPWPLAAVVRRPASPPRLLVGAFHDGRRHWCILAGLGRAPANRATPANPLVRPVLAPDLASTVACAGVDPTLEGRALQDALLREIPARRGYCWWDVDHAGWVVTLDSPREHFHGRRLEEGLAWCPVWLMAPEIGIGPFRV